MKLGLIGAGNMGEALIRSALRAGTSSQNIMASASFGSERLIYLTNRYNIRPATTNIDIVRESDVVLLCVKPFLMEQVCNQIRGHLNNTHAIFSVAAGVKVRKIKDWLFQDEDEGHELERKARISAKSPIPIIRCMPNIPISIGQGIVALYRDPPDIYIKDEMDEFFDVQMLKYIDKIITKIFGQNKSIWLEDERKIDIATVISGCGPGFLSLIANEFVKTGTELGLSKYEAEVLVSQTFVGSGALFLEEPISDIQKQVASKGGATEEGLSVLDQWGSGFIFNDVLRTTLKRVDEINSKLE